MRPSIRMLQVAAAAAALALSAALPAHAQNATTLSARPRTLAGVANQRMIDDAVREFGFRPERLRRDQLDALDQAWSDLLPGASRRDRLNPRQATAIVYLALVYPAGTGRDPFPGRDDDRWERGPRRECREMGGHVYEILNIARASEFMMFLDNDERERSRRAAGEVQRVAIQTGERAVADRASEVVAVLSPHTLSARADLLPRAQALHDALDQGCGRGR